MAENLEKTKNTQASNHARQTNEFFALKIRHFTTVSDRRAQANFKLDKQQQGANHTIIPETPFKMSQKDQINNNVVMKDYTLKPKTSIHGVEGNLRNSLDFGSSSPPIHF